MKRKMVFDGAKAPKRFRLLWSLYSFGISASARDNRTVDDMRREAAIQKALESVSVEWVEAKDLGVAPKDLLKQEQDDIRDAVKNGTPIEEWVPRVPGGHQMRFLRAEQAEVLLPVKEFERLVALVEKAAPHTAAHETIDVVDLLDFLASCDKVEEG